MDEFDCLFKRRPSCPSVAWPRQTRGLVQVHRSSLPHVAGPCPGCRANTFTMAMDLFREKEPQGPHPQCYIAHHALPRAEPMFPEPRGSPATFACRATVAQCSPREHRGRGGDCFGLEARVPLQRTFGLFFARDSNLIADGPPVHVAPAVAASHGGTT